MRKTMTFKPFEVVRRRFFRAVERHVILDQKAGNKKKVIYLATFRFFMSYFIHFCKRTRP